LRVEAPTRHRLCTKAVSLAQNHRHPRHLDAGRCNEHPAEVSHLGGLLRIGSHHEPGGVAEAHDRQVEGVAQLHEPGRLVGRVRVDRATEVSRIVRDDAHGAPLYAREDREDPDAELGAQLERRVDVCESLDSATHVVDAGALLGDHVAQDRVLVATPVTRRALEESEVFLGDSHRLGLVGDADIHHAVAHLHVDRSNVGGGDGSESATLDHRRAGHADVRVLRCDDDVTTAEEGRIPREAVARGDPHQRHEARESRKEREGHAVEPGHTNRIGVARPAPAALGKEHERQSQVFGHGEEAVLLAVVQLTLGAGEHRVVVRGDGDARCILAEGLAPDRGEPAHESVGGSVADQIVEPAAATLGGDRECPVLDEGALVDQVGDVCTRGALSLRCAPCHGVGSRGVEREVASFTPPREIGALAGVRRAAVRSGGRTDDSGFHRQQNLAGGDGLALCDADRGDDAVASRRHRMLHLHRLDDHDLVAGMHLVAGPDENARNRSYEGRDHTVLRLGHVFIVPQAMSLILSGVGSLGANDEDW